MAEQQNRSLLPDWLAEVETCAQGSPTRPKPVLKGAWMWVDRGVAEGLLAMNTMNRQLRPKRLAEYIQLMSNGLWDETTPQMIVFDTELRMADGQHRCRSIIDSGYACWCLVVWGIEPSARLNIDRGGIRNSADNVMMAGFGHLIPGDSKRALELANAFVQGMRPGKVSLGPAAFQNVLEQYGETLARAVSLYEGHPRTAFFSRAAVRGMVARALHHGVSADSVKRFVSILITGFSEGRPGDKAAITLRNLYTDPKTKKKGSFNSNENAAIYAKCARALLCYLRGEDRIQLQPVSADPWPIDVSAIGASVAEVGVIEHQPTRSHHDDFMVNHEFRM